MQNQTESVDFDEFDEESPQRSPLEFRGPNGLVVRELVSSDDAEEMLEFINANRAALAEYADQLNDVQTPTDAEKRLGDQRFSTFGARIAANQPLAAIGTVMQETQDRVSLGYAVGKDFRRQGIGSGLVKTLAHNYLRIPEIETVRCYVLPANRASRLLLGKCGFHLSGGVTHSHVFYDLNKGDVSG